MMNDGTEEKHPELGRLVRFSSVESFRVAKIVLSLVRKVKKQASTYVKKETLSV